MEVNSIKEFTESFFKSLDCELNWENDALIVKRVPSVFEDYYGKKGPYCLVFEREKEGENSELMVKGSFLLKAMTTFLETRGQTAILKINFDFDPKTEIARRFSLTNSSLFSVVRKPLYNLLLRFTFLTTLQYLNEKEQITNQIYVNNGKIINFDISKFNVIEGKKEEVVIPDVKTEYALAKSQLKPLLSQRISEISALLNSRLEKEIERVKSHYEIHIKEIDDELKRNLEQLKECEAMPEKDISIQNKIKRLKEHIEKLQNLDRSAIEKEKEFFINDEVHKHGLSIDNKLVNTSIIYYPDFILQAFLKTDESGRQLEIPYEPLTGKMGAISCDSCNESIQNISLCSSGHVLCRKCMETCDGCNKIICKKCIKKLCEHCGRKMCRKCDTRCSNCSKHVCRLHISRDSATGREACISCVKRCSKCNQSFLPQKLRKVNSQDICEKCFRLSSLRM